jgi:hypothetical protein
MLILIGASCERHCGANQLLTSNWRQWRAVVPAYAVSPTRRCSAVAAQEGRMLLSHDHHTLPRHFSDFITAQASPGVIIMSQRMLISVAVEWIMTIWAASEAEEWVNQISILPR